MSDFEQSCVDRVQVRFEVCVPEPCVSLCAALDDGVELAAAVGNGRTRPPGSAHRAIRRGASVEVAIDQGTGDGLIVIVTPLDDHELLFVWGLSTTDGGSGALPLCRPFFDATTPRLKETGSRAEYRLGTYFSMIGKLTIWRLHAKFDWSGASSCRSTRSDVTPHGSPRRVAYFAA